MKERDVVFNILQQMLSASPAASYERLNPALRSTLVDCISADLPFQPDTFRRIYNELRGNRWFGDAGGSHIGEHFYSHAVEVNHASAYRSFELFANRAGVLWEEDAARPFRLHVGSQFTWRGYYVTVTSMHQDRLVACTYKDAGGSAQGIKVGAMINDYSRRRKSYIITSAKREGDAHILRVIKAKPTDGDRIVARRFIIRYNEIAEFRGTERVRLKKVLEEIAKCDPGKDCAKLSKLIAAEHFRHFQLEKINAAFAKRKDWIAGQARIEAWRRGANGAWLDVKEILLRVNDDLVECSNGNRVSVATVRRVLPIILDRRNTSGSLNLRLDSYAIQNISANGVKVGCTLVPWAEVDRIALELGVAKGSPT